MKCVVCLEPADVLYHGFSLCSVHYKRSQWWLGANGTPLASMIKYEASKETPKTAGKKCTKQYSVAGQLKEKADKA